MAETAAEIERESVRSMSEIVDPECSTSMTAGLPARDGPHIRVVKFSA